MLTFLTKKAFDVFFWFKLSTWDVPPNQHGSQKTVLYALNFEPSFVVSRGLICAINRHFYPVMTTLNQVSIFASLLLLRLDFLLKTNLFSNCYTIPCSTLGLMTVMVSGGNTKSRSEDFHKKWIEAYRKGRWKPIFQARVCSDHFSRHALTKAARLFKPKDRQETNLSSRPNAFNFEVTSVECYFETPTVVIISFIDRGPPL